VSSIQPESWPTVIPRIVTPDVAGLVKFIQDVFRAQGELRVDRPTDLRIGNSIVMISDGGGVVQPMAAFLYVYVSDIDAAYQRAVAAGATSIEEPADQHYGDRRAAVRDAWGNTWQIATPARQPE
jgi:PhnB protein